MLSLLRMIVELGGLIAVCVLLGLIAMSLVLGVNFSEIFPIA